LLLPEARLPSRDTSLLWGLEEAMGELMLFAVWVILRIWEDHRAIAWGPRGSTTGDEPAQI